MLKEVLQAEEKGSQMKTCIYTKEERSTIKKSL
jgi:hypothetical protein